jgi:hypothetical protein
MDEDQDSPPVNTAVVHAKKPALIVRASVLFARAAEDLETCAVAQGGDLFHQPVFIHLCYLYHERGRKRAYATGT